MKKLSKLYSIYLMGKWSPGIQYVKARNKKHAKEKFKKRFKKARIMDCTLVENPEFYQQSFAI